MAAGILILIVYYGWITQHQVSRCMAGTLLGLMVGVVSLLWLVLDLGLMSHVSGTQVFQTPLPNIQESQEPGSSKHLGAEPLLPQSFHMIVVLLVPHTTSTSTLVPPCPHPHPQHAINFSCCSSSSINPHLYHISYHYQLALASVPPLSLSPT